MPILQELQEITGDRAMPAIKLEKCILKDRWAQKGNICQQQSKLISRCFMNDGEMLSIANFAVPGLFTSITLYLLSHV